LFDLADAMAGKTIRCGRCQVVFTVPAPVVPRRETVPEETLALSNRPRSPAPRPSARRPSPPPPLPQPATGPSKHNNVPWLVGGAVACVALITAGAVVVAMLLRDRPRQREQASKDPVSVITDGAPKEKPPEKPPPIEKPPPVEKPPVEKPPPVVKEEEPPKRPSGELSREALNAVKRATVFLRVTLADGTASGTGFFGDNESPNIVLTNAHVVGMLSPASQPPRRIEVVINSGEKDERRMTARVVGVDRSSDLAVLDVGSNEGMPKPLTVKPARALRELDKVYVFGFPLGERLGKEITVRPSSVSSMRKRSGVLDKIQVNGGMDPGNSGGPVVDENGHVVGVAVSGIPGRMINFAIPGERVHALLDGGIAAMSIGAPFKEGGEVGVPVLLELLDPCGRIKDMALDVWTGNPPPVDTVLRPPSETAPEQEPGDAKRQRIHLSTADGIARADVMLPALPEGKVYWLQPTWSLANSKGGRRWASAGAYRLRQAPVERKTITLESRHMAGATARRVAVSVTNSLRAGGPDSELAAMSTRVVLSEKVAAASAKGAKLTLAYQSGARELTVKGKPRSSPLSTTVQPALRTLTMQVDLDAAGNVQHNTLANLAQVRRHRLGKELISFHEPIKQAVEALLLPLPNKRVAARETWKTERTLGVETPDGFRPVRVDLTCAYLGVRDAAGREEALIGVEGPVRDSRLGGRARGHMTADVATGTVTRIELDVEVDIPAVGVDVGGKTQKITVRSAMALRLERAP
jgi:S1-C subfamily serine protease